MWVVARNTQLKYFREVPLYLKSDKGEYVLYKPPGITLDDMRISDGRHPNKLYMKRDDKIKGIQEAQEGFNLQLGQDIKSGDLVRVKETLTNIVEETLTEPRSGSLEGVSKTVDILVMEYSEEADVLQKLVSISAKDYTTVIHSINVMALTLGFCFYDNYLLEDAKTFGLSSLLHDVGKTQIPNEILQSERKLTHKEFEVIKNHTKIGHQILKESLFHDENISLGALEHHEKLDGSGYPHGINKISLVGQLLGIVDYYEALTNDDRLYRSALIPLEALNLIKKDVKVKKYNLNIFEKFAYSLI